MLPHKAWFDDPAQIEIGIEISIVVSATSNRCEPGCGYYGGYIGLVKSGRWSRAGVEVCRLIWLGKLFVPGTLSNQTDQRLHSSYLRIFWRPPSPSPLHVSNSIEGSDELKLVNLFQRNCSTRWIDSAIQPKDVNHALNDIGYLHKKKTWTWPEQNWYPKKTFSRTSWWS